MASPLVNHNRGMGYTYIEYQSHRTLGFISSLGFTFLLKYLILLGLLFGDWGDYGVGLLFGDWGGYVLNLLFWDWWSLVLLFGFVSRPALLKSVASHCLV